MLLNEALVLQDGDTVCHPAKIDIRKNGTQVRPPLRITKVWINAKRTIVLIRIHAIAQQAWLDATAYDLPPAGMAFDKLERDWVAPAELKRRVHERRYGKPAA